MITATYKTDFGKIHYTFVFRRAKVRPAFSNATNSPRAKSMRGISPAVVAPVQAIILLCVLAAIPLRAQWSSILKSSVKTAVQTATQSPTTTTRTRSDPSSTEQDRQIEASKKGYDIMVAGGNENGAAVNAELIGMKYEQKEDYTNAADWYRKGYAKGNGEGSIKFINLVLLNKVTVDNPDSIRTFVEVRALCGSHIARAYVLDHWHETPTQIPDYPADQKFTGCGPVGPDDRMEGNLWQQRQIAQRQREQAQQDAEYYRQHPDQDPKVKAQKAAEGAALLLGALLIQAANMPATGPGSIACNKLNNHYPGADPSACKVPPAK